MGQRGPAPVPTALRVLRGNPSRRKVATDEPKPKRKKAVCPKWLDGEAGRLFKRLARELDDLGLMTTVDAELLAAYCREWCYYVEACERIAQDGAIIVGTNKQGSEYEMQSPWVNIRTKALLQVLAIAKRFGFSPADRVGLHAPDKRQADPLSQLTGGDGAA